MTVRVPVILAPVHGVESAAKIVQESTVDPSMDVELFRKAFGIMVRFAKRAE